MKKYILYIFITCMISWAYSQSCEANLDNAKINYINGNFEKVFDLLEKCAGQLERAQDNMEAFELLINSLQILNLDSLADISTKSLLQQYPLYIPKQTALTSYKRLVESYTLRKRFGFTFYAGVNRPEFAVMQYRSYGGIVEESASYQSSPGLSTGLMAQYYSYPWLSFSTGLTVQNSSFSLSETIMGFQKLDVEENLVYLKIPASTSLNLEIADWELSISGGISFHHLLSDKANIELYGTALDFANPLTGISRKASNYSLKSQRRSYTINYQGAIAVKKNIGLFSIDLIAQYEYGLNNLVKPNERYTSDELIYTYSYVPDDFKMNNIQLMIGVTRYIVYPKKIQQ